MSQVTRRSFLRNTAGISGATLSLPFLPSLASTTHAAAGAKAVGAKAVAAPAQRFLVYYTPIGVVRSAFFPGEAEVPIPKWVGNTKASVEAKFTKVGQHELAFTPTLQPLKKMRDKVALVTGMDRTFQSGTDVHAQCGSCFLSSAAPYTIKSSAWPLDRTLDHVIADVVGDETPFRSLEFSANSHKDNKESIHFDNISWYGTGQVAPSLRDPHRAYQRLFGSQQARRFKSITDLVLEDAKSLSRELGAADRRKFDEYFESVRSIERRIVKLQSMKDQLAKVKLEAPPAAYLPRGEYITLMSDLMLVALQSGLTNVATMMVGPERWDTPFKFEGLFDKPMSHHQMSHNQHKFTKQLQQLDRFHMQQFADLLQRMDAIEEANGTTLLDNTLVTYGSGLGDGATHQYNDLPIVVAGGRGRLRTGKHHHLPNGTPLANLWLTHAQLMGVKTPRFADSTGPLNALLKA